MFVSKESEGGMSGAAATSVESEFDPCELIGTHIPFVDPFGFDERDFRTEGFFPTFPQTYAAAANMPALHGSATRAQPLVGPSDSSGQISAPRPSPLPPHGRTTPAEQLAAVTIDTHPHFPELERNRLTAAQAINIFHYRNSKTARTAGLLAAKYGILSKAIRDIWTLKSWAAETKPHWSPDHQA